MLSSTLQLPRKKCTKSAHKIVAALQDWCNGDIGNFDLQLNLSRKSSDSSCLAKYSAVLLVEYYANSSGGGGLWHATCDRHLSVQLSFEDSWSLLLNYNSRQLVPITDCSNSN